MDHWQEKARKKKEKKDSLNSFRFQIKPIYLHIFIETVFCDILLIQTYIKVKIKVSFSKYKSFRYSWNAGYFHLD